MKATRLVDIGEGHMAHAATSERAMRAKETRLRRLASDQGLGLEQGPPLDPETADQWRVIDPSAGWAIATQPTLDQVERFIKGYRDAAMHHP